MKELWQLGKKWYTALIEYHNHMTTIVHFDLSSLMTKSQISQFLITPIPKNFSFAL